MHALKLLLEVIFWSGCGLIAYTYIGYPLLLFMASSIHALRQELRRMLGSEPSPATSKTALPGVSVVVAAHNEEQELPGLIECLRRTEYPRERWELVVVSDGSDDGSDAYLEGLRESWIQVVRQPHQGKATALNTGVARARHGILLLMDASTRPQPDTLRRLALPFEDTAVGVVCGALRFRHTADSSATEGAYWSYECLLRLMEGRLGATLTASGALYAVRRCCFPPLDAAAWIEDFLIPMQARRRGYRVLYEPEALAWETPAPSVQGEFRRRTRLAVGSFRALGTLVGTRLDATTRWAFISHKLLRWSVPFLLLATLLANLVLCAWEPYRALLIAQLAGYGLAGAAGLGLGPLRRSRLARALYFFLAMNAAFLWGFVLFMRDSGATAWEQVR